MSGYDSYPIDITVNGRYRDVQRFVHELRTQAGSSHGRVQASGRLFAVESVNMTPAPDGLPELAAAIVVDAFVYSGVVPADRDRRDDPTDGSEAARHHHLRRDLVMSSVTKSWAPTKSDPAAAAARKRKILLGVLVVLLVAILAFELPRLMHRSSGAAPTRRLRPRPTASRPGS